MFMERYNTRNTPHRTHTDIEDRWSHYPQHQLHATHQNNYVHTTHDSTLHMAKHTPSPNTKLSPLLTCSNTSHLATTAAHMITHTPYLHLTSIMHTHNQGTTSRYEISVCHEASIGSLTALPWQQHRVRVPKGGELR